MSSQDSAKLHFQQQEVSTKLSFLSLPLELRNQIYVYLQRPKTFMGSPTTTYFDAQVYDPSAASITLTNKQIRDEASQALHMQHSRWAFKVTAYLWDTEVRLRVLARRMKWIQRIDLRFDHICNELYHLLYISDGVPSEANDPMLEPCQICERHDSDMTDFRNIRINMVKFCETFAQMPALQTLPVSWIQFEGVDDKMAHDATRCLIGCEYPGGVPVLQDLAEYQAELSTQPDWMRSKIEKVNANIPVRGVTNAGPCPLIGLTPEERKLHYWKQVGIVQDVVGKVLEPLLALPDHCVVERGKVSVTSSHMPYRTFRRVHVFERGFANALDRVIELRQSKKGRANASTKTA